MAPHPSPTVAANAAPADLMALVGAFRSSRIVLTAFELGVFTALGSAARTSSAVARAVRADARAVDRLLNALCALGLVSKRGGRFRNSPFSERFLVEGKPGYMAGLAHTANMWTSWARLTESVRRGGALPRPRATRAANLRRTRGFIAGMHQRASAQAAETVKLIDLTGVRSVVHVGGGSGAYAMAFVRAGGGIRATVFDLPDVVPLARRYVRKEGLSKRVSYRIGDFHTDDLGRGYDLVLLSAIIHMNSPAANRRLFKTCVRALNPGGRLVVQDFIMDEDRTRPATGAFFALNMIIGTPAGDTYPEREVKSGMRAAGLSRIERRDTPFDSALIIGRKPAA